MTPMSAVRCTPRTSRFAQVGAALEQRSAEWQSFLPVRPVTAEEC